MKLATNFYNDFSRDYRAIYFPNENHGTTENANYWNSKDITEIFNNGGVSYNRFIVKLSRYCGTTAESIDNLMSKYIIK